MEAIKEIVTTIVIILILASLLEMILPNSSMQRFVKLIMGLFIIITLLNPIVGFINKDHDQELLNWQVMDENKELDSILTKGKALNQLSKDKAVKEYEQRLGQQILSITRLSNDLQIQRAEVKVNKDGKQVGYGQIDEVILVLGDDKGEGGLQKTKEAIEPIAPIKVKIKEEGNEELVEDNTKPVAESDSKALQKAIDAVTNFYGLDKNQVIVKKAAD